MTECSKLVELIAVLFTLLVASCTAQQAGTFSLGVLPDKPVDIDALRTSTVACLLTTSAASWSIDTIQSSFSAALFSSTSQNEHFGFSFQRLFPATTTTTTWLSIQNSSTPVRTVADLTGLSSLPFILYFDPTRPMDLILVFGPAAAYAPENFEDTITITFPSRFFVNRDNSSMETAVAKVHFTGKNDRTTQAGLSLMATSTLTAGAVLSGASGWMGLANLQTFLLMMNGTCAETNSRYYFQDSTTYFAIPFSAPTNHVNSYTFAASIACVVLSLMIHAFAALVIHWCSGSSNVSWRRTAQTIFFPGPFFFLTVYLWVGITVTSYREVVDSTASVSRPSLILTWAFVAIMLAVLWFDGLKRGFDGHFYLYSKRRDELGNSIANIFSGPMLYKLGRFQHWFLPCGRWMNTRGYGVLRACCTDQSYRFAWMTLVPITLFAAVTVNNDDCGWYFGVIFAIEALHLIVFLYFMPFRVPLLNFSWVGSKVTVLTICALQLYWIGHANTPNNKTAVSIQLACTAYLAILGVYILYNFLVTVIERSLATRENLTSVFLAISASDSLFQRSNLSSAIEMPLLRNSAKGGGNDSGLSKLFESSEIGEDSVLDQYVLRQRAAVPLVDAARTDDEDDGIDVGDAYEKVNKDPELEEILALMYLKHGSALHNDHHQIVDASSTRSAKEKREVMRRARKESRLILHKFWTGEPMTHKEGFGGAGTDAPSAATEGALRVIRAANTDRNDWSKTYRRAALKILPRPKKLSKDQLAFLIEAASGPGTVLDISAVGNALFVGMKSFDDAIAAGNALNGRFLFDEERMQCDVIEDAAQ